MSAAWLSAWALLLLTLDVAALWLQRRATPWLMAGLRLALHVGLTLGALTSGALGPATFGLGRQLVDQERWMGFTPMEWLRGIGAALLAVSASLLVVGLVRATSAQHVTGEDEVLLALAATCDELRWALYRAALIAWADDVYIGAALALMPISAEWVIHQRWRPPNADIGQGLVRAWCASLSFSLYVATQNLWLGIVAHIALRVIGQAWLSHPTNAVPPRASSR
ncbi:MAG: hypothetical protein ACK4WM_03680 [Thermoflexales bacterium]